MLQKLTAFFSSVLTKNKPKETSPVKDPKKIDLPFSISTKFLINGKEVDSETLERTKQQNEALWREGRVDFKCLKCGAIFSMKWEPGMRNATCNSCRTRHVAEDNNGSPRLVKIFDWKVDFKRGKDLLAKIQENQIELPSDAEYEAADQYLGVSTLIEKMWLKLYEVPVSKEIRNKIIRHIFSESKIVHKLAGGSYGFERQNAIRKNSKLYSDIVDIFNQYR